MSKPEVPVQKSRASGTWRAVRSMTVPASVASLHSNAAPSNHTPDPNKIQKVEQQSVLPKQRKYPGYFENADPSFSKS